jgi:hypothetical protein
MYIALLHNRDDIFGKLDRIWCALGKANSPLQLFLAARSIVRDPENTPASFAKIRFKVIGRAHKLS